MGKDLVRNKDLLFFKDFLPKETLARSWEEDFLCENGRYMNLCIYCKENFVGYKRKVCCKTCSLSG